MADFLSPSSSILQVLCPRSRSWTAYSVVTRSYWTYQTARFSMSVQARSFRAEIKACAGSVREFLGRSRVGTGNSWPGNIDRRFPSLCFFFRITINVVMIGHKSTSWSNRNSARTIGMCFRPILVSCISFRATLADWIVCLLNYWSYNVTAIGRSIDSDGDSHHLLLWKNKMPS